MAWRQQLQEGKRDPPKVPDKANLCALGKQLFCDITTLILRPPVLLLVGLFFCLFCPSAAKQEAVKACRSRGFCFDSDSRGAAPLKSGVKE